ncbi:MAG: hypothetical protein AB7V48_10150 [Sedimentibacter sp.]
MKKITTFLSGFLCCFILVVLLNSLSVDGYANSNVFQFTNVTYPIYINGEKSDTEAYNFKGNTYLKIADLNKNLKNLNVHWSDEKREVNIVEATGLGYMHKDGIEYVDIRRLIERSTSGVPNGFNLRTGSFYWDGYNEETYIGIEAEMFKMDSTEYYPNLYIEKKLFEDNLPKLLQMFSENEYYIKNNPELFPDIGNFDSIKNSHN